MQLTLELNRDAVMRVKQADETYADHAHTKILLYAIFVVLIGEISLIKSCSKMISKVFYHASSCPFRPHPYKFADQTSSYSRLKNIHVIINIRVNFQYVLLACILDTYCENTGWYREM